MGRIASAFITLGTLLLITGLGLLFLIFYPILLQEIGYDIEHLRDSVSSHQNLSSSIPQITPASTDFGIVIPKIKANSKIVANVDPYNPAIYQAALTKGVAQAQGSALPYEDGNMFLFSHSSVNFYEAQKYNSVFYLLHKLETGDTIDIYYAEQKYTYKVTGKKIVNPSEVSYLQKGDSQHTLTLMTCWPPGTSLQRLLIQAERVETEE